MQLGSTAVRSASARLASAACLGIAFALAAPASADEFEAFTWAYHHPASTEHVTPLIQIDPWFNTDLATVSARLKSLPAGKRFLILQGITEELADHPSDRVIERSWQIRTRQVPVASTAPQASSVAARGTGKLASQGRAPGSAAASAASPGGMATITERVPVDRLTQFRGPWMDNGIVSVRARIQSMFAQLKSMDTPVDGVAIANETTLHAACFLGQDGSLAAIQSDPRWPALAASMGLATLQSDMSWGSSKYFLWTARMAGRFDAAMNRAVFAPIRSAYPHAVVSNYSTGRLLGQFATPDVNGHLDRRATNGFGTHDNFEFYGWLAHWRIEKTRGSLPVDEVDQAWLAFRVEMHKIRGMNASSSRPKHAWIGQRSWQGMWWGPIAFASDPLWDELVLQLGMHGVRQFFELGDEDFSTTREANLERRAADRAALQSVLAELNARVSESSTGVLTAAQPSWEDRVIATGCKVGDRFVWRFSFAPGIDAVNVRLSDGTEVTVVAEEGRRGAWFEHPASVRLRLDPTGRVPLIQVVTPEGSQDPGT